MKQKRKVLLLNPPFHATIIRDNYCCFTSKTDYLWPPVDLLYLSGNLNYSNIQLEVIDAVAEKQTWKNVKEFINSFNPDRIVCLTGTASFPQDMRGLQQAVVNSKSKLYVLGNTPTIEPEMFLTKYKFVDGIIHNFFDAGIKDLMMTNDKWSPSFTVRKADGSIQLGRINYLKPGSEITLHKHPQYKLFKLNKYSTPVARKQPMVTVLTAFGCPFTCKFCVASILNYYPRNRNDLKKEFDAIHQAGIKEIFFQDSTFNANPTHLNSVLDLLIDYNYNFSWSANVHSFHLTEEKLKKMKRAGCHTLQIGVESGNQQTLNKFAPSKQLPNILNAVALCRKVGIRSLGYFILGFPNESEAMLQNTIKFALKLNPDFASFTILTPDYGTDLYNETMKTQANHKAVLRVFDPSRMTILKHKQIPEEKLNNSVKYAHQQFYLRPKKILKYLVDYKQLKKYVNNGMKLLS